MPLFILKPRMDLRSADDPWDSWSHSAFRFVVRAQNETEARKLAQDNGGNEMRTKAVWLSAEYTICELLTQEGVSMVICRDFASA